MQYSFRSLLQRNPSITVLLIRNAPAYSILDKKQMKKKIGTVPCLFPNGVLWCYILSWQEKKFWLLGFSGIWSFSACFHFKWWYPMDCLFNDNGLSTLIVKQSIWMIVFYHIQGPLSSNLFSQYIWALTLCSVVKYCDGNREPRKVKFLLLLLVIYLPITSKLTDRNTNGQGTQRFGRTQWSSYLNIYLSKTECIEQINSET